MKAFVSVLFIATFLFAAATSVGQRQNPQQPLYGDFRDQLPGFNDNWVVRNENVNRPAREARVLTRGPLAPSDADRATYAGFLKQSNTGLMRLLPRTFQQSKFYSKPPVKITGSGAYYSFSHFSHEYGYGSDLELSTTLMFRDGIELPPTHQLSVGFAGADFGMLTNLGELPLEAVASDLRTEFMRAYKAPRREAEARNEFRRFRAGVTLNGQIYKNRLPIQVGATYLLRSINYSQSDVLVAFRVVREDTDGSVIIAWRLLRRFGTPRLMNRYE
ncbi:MAG: hypothetical protein ACXW3C_00065 [Pyrinomonadaceae bacterium]